jgi:hypothetical protein
MKKYLPFLAASLFAVTTITAQEAPTGSESSSSSYMQCVRMRETEPLWKITQENPTVTRFTTPKEAADGDAHRGVTASTRGDKKDIAPDPVVQTTEGTLAGPATIENFDGVAGQGYVPLDPNGMVGPSYYVQTINSVYAIWNKNGTAKLGQTDLSKLFGSFTCDDGDPVTMYDKFADRWIISEFQENDKGCTGSGVIDTLMFAVSETNDPTGKYYLYYFCPDPTTQVMDYPKYTIWADGYYMTCNCQNTDWVIVFDRTNMLAGSKTAGFIKIQYNYSPFASGCGGGFYCPMMMYADGSLPPYGEPNYLLDYQDPNWGGSCATKNDIRIFKVSVNWTSKTGSIALAQTLTTAAFNSTFPNDPNRNDLDQPGSANYASLDVSDGFFSYRIPFIRWSNYNAAVMCNVVNTGTNPTSGSAMAGIRWYELRQDTTTKSWSIYQQGTYAPADNVSRFCPAIAMDQNGSIGLQFSVSDPKSIYPGLRFTGRTLCDTLGKMGIGETTVVAGNAVANTSLRWGDYSHLSIDPSDGVTFWGTSMYANSKIGGSNVTSHIYSTKITACSPTGISEIPAIAAELKAYQNGSMLEVIGTKLPQCNNVYVELYDINGKKIMGTNVMPSSNELHTSLNVSTVASGIYFVRILNDSFQRTVKVAIN